MYLNREAPNVGRSQLRWVIILRNDGNDGVGPTPCEKKHRCLYHGNTSMRGESIA